jgi:hypothetical protein
MRTAGASLPASARLIPVQPTARCESIPGLRLPTNVAFTQILPRWTPASLAWFYGRTVR